MIEAIHLKYNGDQEDIELDNDNLLKALQEAVDGYIEIVRIPGDSNMILVVNEDGLLKQLPVNAIASAIARQPIVGNAVMIQRSILE